MYIETNEQVQYEIKELVQIMANYLKETDKNSPCPWHKPFIHHMNRFIYLMKKEVVSMRETRAYILRKYHKQPGPLTEEEEKCRIISTAAKFIKADMRSQITADNKYYPSKEDLNLENSVTFLPGSLKKFLESLVVGQCIERKVVSIGQRIIQAVCQQSLLAPLQLGLANQVYHHYRSDYLGHYGYYGKCHGFFQNRDQIG